MFCPNCGKQLPDGVKFCTGCGTALAGPAPAPAPAPRHTAPQPAPAPKKRSKAGLVIGLAAAAAAAALGAFVIAPRLSAGGGGQTAAQGEADSAATEAEVEYTLDDLDYDGTLPGVYAPPAELGSDPVSFCFSLDGTLYQMPVPVSVFEADGWTLESAGRIDLPKRLEGKESYPAALKKGDGMCRVKLWNSSEESVAARECDVVELTASNGDGASLTIPEGITLGMDGQTLDSIVEPSETTYHFSDAAGMRTLGVYPDDDTTDTDCVQITYDMTADTVTDILVHRDMRPGVYPVRALGKPERLDEETMAGPCYMVYSGLWGLERWQSIVDDGEGLALADQLLGMDQAGIDPDIFQVSEDDPNRYSMRLDELYGGFHFLLGGKIIGIDLTCQDAKVVSVRFTMGFGHGELLGRGQAVTAEEYADLAAGAIAAFGEGYEHTGTGEADMEGLPEDLAGVLSLLGSVDTYAWPGLDLSYHADWGYVSADFYQ